MSLSPTDVDLDRAHEHLRLLRAELSKAIVGQNAVLDELLTAFLAGGHALLVGVPGLAKTRMVRALAEAVQLDFRRVQFTPDLMPTDVLGTEVLEEDRTTGKRLFRFIPGPIFTHLLLADEINRTPPKTQAALLEAMQERAVTVAGETRPLEPPFFVLATQNPIEQAGTYALPEAQLDRFLLSIAVGYPDEAEEIQILQQTAAHAPPVLRPVMTRADVLALQRAVSEVLVADELVAYAARLVRASRPGSGDATVDGWVRWGAGPRAGQALLVGAKALAFASGRVHVSTDDLRRLAKPVLRHRVLPTFQAEAEGITADRVIEHLLAQTAPPRGRL